MEVVSNQKQFFIMEPKTVLSFQVGQKLIHAICISGLNVDIIEITYLPDENSLEKKKHYDVFFEQNGDSITAKGFKEEKSAKEYAFSFKNISEVKAAIKQTKF